MHMSLIVAIAFASTCFWGATARADNHAEEKPGLFGTTFLEGWTKNIGAGISGSDGTTSEVKVTANATGEYEDERHRRKFQANLYISKPDSPNGTTDRKAFVEYEENYKPFGNSIYLIGTARYDYDRLLSANSRIAPSAGVGMDLHQSEKLTIRASIGAGLSHTWDRNGGTVPEGVLRASADYNVTKGMTFAMTHTYYPNIDDPDELRVISNAELKADIGEEGGLAASVGLNNEYDTTAEGRTEDNEKNDLTYFLRLGYDF
jgi:putative salt-induced outer membrane protein YdiY